MPWPWSSQPPELWRINVFSLEIMSPLGFSLQKYTTSIKTWFWCLASIIMWPCMAKKIDFAFVILLGILNLGNYFGLSRCTHCSQWLPFRSEADQSRRGTEVRNKTEGADVRVTDQQPYAKEDKWPAEAGQGCPGPPTRNQHCWNLDLGSTRHILDSICVIRNLWLVEICSTRNSSLTQDRVHVATA